LQAAGQPYVELVHWFHQILQAQDSDMHRIVRHFQLDRPRLAKDFTEALDRLPRGATSISDLSSHVEEAVERGWVYGSLHVRRRSGCGTGHLTRGALKTSSLRNGAVRDVARVRKGQGRPPHRGVRRHRRRLARDLAARVGVAGVARRGERRDTL